MKNFNIKHVLSGLLLFGIVMSTPTILFSQGNNNTLSFAPNYLLQGGPTANLPSFPNNVNNTYHGQSADFAHTAIQDELGELLFFVVDDKVFDSEGYLIDELTGITNDIQSVFIKGKSEILVVPNPYNCNQYYLFSSHLRTNASFEPFFTVIDLDLPNVYHTGRFGAINIDQNISLGSTAISLRTFTPNFELLTGNTVPNRGIDNQYFAAPKIQICNSDQFVYLSSSNGVFQYIINQQGLSFTGNYFSFDFNGINGQVGSAGQRGEMEVIELPNENFRLATPFKYINDNDSETGIAIYYCDIDSDGNLVPNSDGHIILPSEPVVFPNPTPEPFIHGLEFSEDGNILYFTHEITNLNPDPINYFDFNDINIGIQEVLFTLPNQYQYSQIETTSDNQLILVKNDRIASIDNSNDPNALIWNPNFFIFNSFSYPISGTSSEWLNAFSFNTNVGIESYIIPKQIKQRSYSDYIYEGGCSQDFGSQTAFNGTWSPGNNPFNSQTGDVYIDFTLIIPAGSNLIIEDMNFFFTPGSKVVVERGNAQNEGAWLTLRRTIFTVDDRCDEEAMWHGVEVLGYGTENQVPFSTTQQGFFRMFDNSGIEHSYLGAVTGAYATETNYPFRPTFLNSTRTGGIIQASNSYFKNNRYDVQYHSYTAPNGIKNQGALTNCDFFTDGTLNDPTVFPTVHILMINVDGISMKGIRIRNETPDDYVSNQQGIGIGSLNSRFFVDPRCLNLIGGCTNFQSSEFRDLYFGVYALSSNGIRTFRVDRNKFINNYFGIYAGGIDNARITRNEFEVYRSAAPNDIFDTYGVFLNSCDGYDVEQNFFTEFNDPDVSVNGNTYGVIVQNSGINDNRIYRNEFTNLLVGGQAQRINGRLSQNITPLIITGLEFKCNTFYKDIFEADLALTSGRIRFEQGDCSASLGIPVQAPAGNLFSYSNLTSQNDFAINPFPAVDQEVKYHHHADNPVDLPVQPLSFNAQMMSTLSCASPQNPILFDENKSCPSTIVDLGIIGVAPLLPTLRFKLDSLKQLITTKESLIDGGNTEGLLEMIENNTKPGTLKNALINASPYISEEVLLAYLSSNPPAGHLNQVIQANSPVSDAVMDALSNMNIPNGIMNQINSSQEGTSEMTYLMSEVNYYNKERTYLLNKTIQLVLNDTIMESPLDTVAAILKDEDNRRRREQLCDTYICKKDSAEFNDERNALEQSYGMDNFIRMADINMTLFENGRLSSDTLQVDNNLREAVEEVAFDEDDEINVVRAEALLDFMLNVRNLPIIEKIEWESVGGKSMIANNNEVPVMETSNVKLFPNPTNGEHVTLLFIEQLPVNPTVIVYSLTGVEMSRTTFKTNEQLSLGVKGLNTGLYIISIESNGELVDNLKLMIK